MRKLLQLASLAVLVSLFLAVIFSSPSSRAQDQPDEERKIVSRVAPLYPELAAKMRITGTVRVAVIVAPNGKPKSTEVLGGNPVLAQSAVNAIEKWTWVSTPGYTRELIQLNFQPKQ